MRMLNQNQKQVRSYLRVTCGYFPQGPCIRVRKLLAPLLGKNVSVRLRCVVHQTFYGPFGLISRVEPKSALEKTLFWIFPASHPWEARSRTTMRIDISARSSCESRASRTAQGWRGKRRRQATILSAITPRCTKKPSDSSPRATPD